MSHWTDRVITYNKKDKVYEGWDETGADIVARNSYKSIVREKLERYATELEKSSDS